MECEDVSEVYNPELWPEGSLVRRYYEPRKMVRNGSAFPISTHDVTGPAGAVAIPSH